MFYPLLSSLSVTNTDDLIRFKERRTGVMILTVINTDRDTMRPANSDAEYSVNICTMINPIICVSNSTLFSGI